MPSTAWRPVQTDSKKWKAVIRKQGWPTAAKTFRTKRDAEDWSRRTEDEMVRGVYIERGISGLFTFDKALDRYLSEVAPTTRPTTQRAEKVKAVPLRKFFGAYSLAAINVDLVARYRDERLATLSQRVSRSTGKAAALSPATVRSELALLGHVFTTAIREWRIGLVQNPVANVRKPVAGAGRDRRLDASEEARLRKAIESYSWPSANWFERFGLADETARNSRRERVDQRLREAR
jgi:hypothetical protein